MGTLRTIALRTAAVTTVAACGLALATAPASAATGTLTIKQRGAVLLQETNPSNNCHMLGKDFPQGDIDVINHTNATVYLYDNLGCQSDPDTTVNPGDTLLGYPGFSSFQLLG